MKEIALYYKISALIIKWPYNHFYWLFEYQVFLVEYAVHINGLLFFNDIKYLLILTSHLTVDRFFLLFIK